MTKQLIAIMAILAVAGSAHAVVLGDDITIFDEDVSSLSGDGWWDQGSDPGENQEVEPGSLTGQQRWDLENMFANYADNTLTLVGGFDFEGGVDSGSRHYGGGHVFIDVDGTEPGGDTAVYGPDAAGTGWGTGNPSEEFNFGYEYALVPTGVDGNTFDIYAVDGLMSYLTVDYSVNQNSNPWQLDVSQYNRLNGADLTMSYYDPNADPDAAGLLAPDAVFGTVDTRYAMNFDLSDVSLSGLGLLDAGNLIHYTIECGNDAMMGRVSAVPDGGVTLALLGCALFALEGLRRKVRR